MRNWKEWTHQEEAWMRKNYRSRPVKQCAKHLGRSDLSVLNKAKSMNLTRTVSRHRMPEWRGGFTVRHAEQYAYYKDGGTCTQIDRLKRRLEEVRDCLTRLRYNGTGNLRHDYEGEELLMWHIQGIKAAISLREAMVGNNVEKRG